MCSELNTAPFTTECFPCTMYGSLVTAVMEIVHYSLIHTITTVSTARIGSVVKTKSGTCL